MKTSGKNDNLVINKTTNSVSAEVKKLPLSVSDKGFTRESMEARYIVFLGLGIMLALIGACLEPSLEALFDGYLIVITHPSMTDFDGFIWAGNYGTAFVNAGIVLILSLAVFYAAKTPIEGSQIAALMLATGFSFYGKNPVNIWFPVIGVFIYAKWKKMELKSVMSLAFFSTSLAPVFSVTAFATEWLPHGGPAAVTLGALLGISAGFLTAFLAAFLPNLHKGMVLYNTGFAAGITGIVIFAIQRTFSLGYERYPYVDGHFLNGENELLLFLLFLMFIYFIAIGLVLGGWHKFKEIVWLKPTTENFVKEFGFGAALMNVGFIGLVSCAYVVAVGGHFNGPLYACVFTSAGFAASGVSFRVFMPTALGVYLMSFITGGVSGMLFGESFISGALAKTSKRGMVLAAIYSCGLAPVAGVHGFAAGIFVGAAHSILVPYTGLMHGWRSLYNNGFSLGIIATFLQPIYSRFGHRKKKHKEEN